MRRIAGIGRAAAIERDQAGAVAADAISNIKAATTALRIDYRQFREVAQFSSVLQRSLLSGRTPVSRASNVATGKRRARCLSAHRHLPARGPVASVGRQTHTKV
ncbi:hypothetical protein BRAS3843_520200 [Bradyrhizobium sp. STM 3843]|nr:hypothetical protein BRAS3843_520200 [Bradyrhizobium sp. STM 3843]